MNENSSYVEVETPNHIQNIAMSEAICEDDGRGKSETSGVCEGDVFCILCYSSVTDYKVDRSNKTLSRASCKGLFEYICTYLDLDIKDTAERGADKIPKESRLQYWNLPLCGSCRQVYYKCIYQTFVEYEALLAKLRERISQHIVQGIAASAKRHNQSVQSMDENTGRNHHNVMKSVNKFRLKVLGKNPVTCEDEKSADVHDQSTSKPAEHQEGNSEIRVSETLDKGGGDDCRAPGPEKVPIKVEVDDDAVSDLQDDSTYYSVSKPYPGIIEVRALSFNEGGGNQNSKPRTSENSITNRKRSSRRGPRYRVEECMKNEDHGPERQIKVFVKPNSGRTVHLSFACKFCSKRVSTRSALVRHEVRVHGKEKPEKCSVCDYRCVDKSRLQKHMETHLDIKDKPKPHQCTLCEAKFRSKPGLTAHLRSHRGEKPYVCEVCGKSFSCRASVGLCIDKHNGVKNQKCHYCEKSFLRKETLDIHIRTHTGEKPFVCSICKKGFAQRAPLKAHLKVHAKKNSAT